MPPADTRGLRALSRVLDDLFPVPGTKFRFGLDPLIGLLPVGGDLAGALLSAWILLAGARMGAPASVLLRMAGNIAIDTLVGAIPLLGDVFDFGFKSNRRNIALLEAFEAAPERVRRASRALVAVVLVLVLALLAGLTLASIWLVRWIAHAL